MARSSFAFRCLLGAGTGALALALSLGGAGIAAAQTDKASPDSSTCGQVMVAGTKWLGGDGVDVKSNGSSEGTGLDCSPALTYVNGVLAGRRWQCTELINRLYLTRGWIKQTWVGSAGLPLWVHTPVGLTKQVNGSVSYLGPGDVVDIRVFHNGILVSGHVFAVNAPKRTVNGAVKLLSQNNADRPIQMGKILHGTVSIQGGGGWTYRVIGVIHAP